jgi:hypothetical protein
MGTTLTGTTPQDTYDSLIKVTDNGPLSGTAKYLSDGLGNDSALALSTARVGVGTATPQGALEVKGDTDYDSPKSIVITHAEPTVYSGFIGLRQEGLANSVMAFGTRSLSVDYLDTLSLSNGKVGIGTNAPAGNLHIASASDTGIRIQGSASGLSYIDLADTASGTPAGSIAYNHISNAIVFATDTNVERARITSNGLSFNGDTAAANALDDYEEGTFTGTLTPSTSGSITVSATTQPFLYTKIGRQVTINGLAVIQSVSSPVGLRVQLGGLPFTTANASNARGSGAVTFFDASASYAFTAVNGYYEPNQSYVTINFDSSTLATNDEFAFTFTYFV